jgi:hypothetical protein
MVLDHIKGLQEAIMNRILEVRICMEILPLTMWPDMHPNKTRHREVIRQHRSECKIDLTRIILGTITQIRPWRIL